MPAMRARGYIAALPHIVRRQENEIVYKAYISDSLWAQGEGKRQQKRWAEIIERKPQDTRTADEIIMDVIRKAGLRLKGQGGEQDQPFRALYSRNAER